MKAISLVHIWSLTKYRGQGLNVEWVIENDITYLTWCMDNDYILLDDDAFKYYEECLNNG